MSIVYIRIHRSASERSPLALRPTVKYEKTCETYLKYQGNLKTVHYAYYEENGKIVKTKDVISWRTSDENVVTVSTIMIGLLLQALLYLQL